VQQNLVGDLDRVVVCGQEAAVDQDGEDVRDIRISVQIEFRERGRATNRDSAISRHGEPQEDGPGDLLLLRRQAPERGLGQPRHRAADTTDLLVLREPERPAVPPLPKLEKRRRQDGQPARLVENSGHQRGGQVMLNPEPCGVRWQLDCPSDLVGCHGADEQVIVTKKLGQIAICRAAAIVVGADGDHDDRPEHGVARDRHKTPNEARALVLVLADREELLELVDDDQQAGAGWQTIQQRRGGTVPGDRSSADRSNQAVPEFGGRRGARTEHGGGPPAAAW
jgi:hypothetical protein